MASHAQWYNKDWLTHSSPERNRSEPIKFVQFSLSIEARETSLSFPLDAYCKHMIAIDYKQTLNSLIRSHSPSERSSK